MSNLRKIKTRISSIKKTEQITNAMKIVSATKLRRQQEILLNIRPYTTNIVDIVKKVSLRTMQREHPYVIPRDTGKTMFVIVTADRGLCGAFNVNILKKSEVIISQKGRENSVLFLIGKKGEDYFKKRREYEVSGSFVNFFNRLSMSHIKEIVSNLSSKYLQDDSIAEVVFIYNTFKNVITHEIVTEKLLPIEPVEYPEDKMATEYIYEPSQGEVLTMLFDKFLQYRIYRILLESYVSELGARMTAMDMATENAHDMIKKLTLQFNKMRQASITKELLEISTGVEAMK